MPSNVHELRLKSADTEKITINLGFVDLGHVDLMVQEGFYSNRTDFIRTAIRNQLERHADVVKQSTARKSLDLGLRHFSREDLETVRRSEGPLSRRCGAVARCGRSRGTVVPPARSQPKRTNPNKLGWSPTI